ncbi:hypothetical protein COO20_21810 [Thalassospira marina]|uniref:Uncharacterized protein n=2 Tax=Thalassospira marina TaxID=2048283 RepID=A0A2N3KGM8_9PROT|nr:hypothetical protein COO20_21810 [Thalassospira marina]
MALEIADERRVGASAPEKIKRRLTPVLSTLKGRNVATMSMEEKFELTFTKVPKYLGQDVAESFQHLVSPVALAVSAASLGLMIAVSDGVIIPVMVAIGYALLGSAIFTIIGDLITALRLVSKASDEQQLDQAAALFARVAAEIIVSGLITLLTLGAARIGARMGKARRIREKEKNKSSGEGSTGHSDDIDPQDHYNANGPQRDDLDGFDNQSTLSGLKPRSMSNFEVREWYHKNLDKIPSQIDRSLPIKDQAMQAFNMRNNIKMEARELMVDQEAVKKLPPPKTLEQVIFNAESKGLKGDEVWDYILGGSQRSNAKVDAALGLMR